MSKWKLSDKHGTCIVNADTGKVLVDYTDYLQALYDDRNSAAEYRYVAGKIRAMLEETVKAHNDDE